MNRTRFKKNKNRQRYIVWLSQAKHDLSAAEGSFKHKDYEWTCYQVNQAVEKALKSVVVFSGYQAPRTHKLGILAGMANRANRLFRDIRFPLRKIESYTFISRYPFIIPGENRTPRDIINKEDAETCLNIGKDILEDISKFIHGIRPSDDDEEVLNGYFFTEKEIDIRLKRVTNDIKSCKNLNVKKIILFGSFAREKTRPKTSTVDILVIADTELDFIARISYVREITRGGEPIVEPIVYTPSEFNHLVYEEGEGFLESALEEGRVLYEEGEGFLESALEEGRVLYEAK